MPRRPAVAIARQYAVADVRAAKALARAHVEALGLRRAVRFGLPEIDDRYHLWRVPVIARRGGTRVGEIVLDARTGDVRDERSTRGWVMAARLADAPLGTAATTAHPTLPPPRLENTITLGDCERVLATIPAGAVDLVFTSPPYFNARVEYADYVSYDAYLDTLRRVIRALHRVLADGRFLVIDSAPVLVRRASRADRSRRLAVPFDLHGILIAEGFEFVDDIIWLKPEGAGWATGRGRRFAADRHPLQYKAVPVTEYVLVYRRATDKLIDWHLRQVREEILARSRIDDAYERTNVWRITPATHAAHPAVFPLELARRVVRYWSFVDDLVLDPFAGVGTVGRAAAELSRRYWLIDAEPRYVDLMRREAPSWADAEATSARGAPSSDHRPRGRPSVR